MAEDGYILRRGILLRQRWWLNGRSGEQVENGVGADGVIEEIVQNHELYEYMRDFVDGKGLGLGRFISVPDDENVINVTYGVVLTGNLLRPFSVEQYLGFLNPPKIEYDIRLEDYTRYETRCFPSEDDVFQGLVNIVQCPKRCTVDFAELRGIGVVGGCGGGGGECGSGGSGDGGEGDGDERKRIEGCGELGDGRVMKLERGEFGIGEGDFKWVD